MTWYDGEAAPTDEPERRTTRTRERPGSRLRWLLGPRAAVGAVLALALVGGAVALRSAAAAPSGTVVDLPEPLGSASTSAPASAPDGTGAGGVATVGTDGAVSDLPEVVVHVVGQIAAPGVVVLPAGSRVADALTAAGGALPDADLSALNLAAVLGDGVQVRVPLPGEVVADVGSGGVVAPPGAATGSADGLVDLGTADAAALEELPGIGPVLAERIVQWRSEHGPFASVDDLRQVSGIGPALLDKLRDRVRV